MIHHTAVIDPRAELDSTVEVGPFVVIGAFVQVGAHCVLGPYTHLTGHTSIGEHNVFHAGCVIGDEPQDFKYHGEPTRLRIGHHNRFREQVTIHRSNKLTDDTVIGSYNYFMANSHAGHNVQMGDYVTLANGALLGGHAIVMDKAIISGNCLVHQFTRVGAMALMQGGSAISQDLPPFTIARGHNGICGLNVVGLRRAGYSSEQRAELKRLYHALFRGDKPLKMALAAAQTEFTSEAARLMIAFISQSKRGVCRDTRNYRGTSASEEDGE